MSDILYIGEHQDVLGRNLGIKDKKIGITTGNVDARQNQLGNTKSPIGYVMLKAWRFSDIDAFQTEQTLHKLFADQKVTGEWFDDDKETIIDGVCKFVDLIRNEYGVVVEDINLDNEDIEGSTSTSGKIARRNHFKPHRDHWKKHLEGRTFTSNPYDHVGYVSIIDGKVTAWLEDEEKYCDFDNPKNAWAHVVKIAHSRKNLTSYPAPNFWLIKDISTKETADNILMRNMGE